MEIDKQTRIRYFKVALRYLLSDKNLKTQKTLSIETGIPSPYLTACKKLPNEKGSRNPSYDKQVVIATAYKKTLDEILTFGRSLVVGEPASPIVPVQPESSNVIQFSGNNTHLSPEQYKRVLMHQYLDTILESGNNVLIAAIESNLVAFAEDVEARKERDQLKRQVAELEEWKRQMEAAK